MKYDLVFEGGGAKGMVFVGACEEFFNRGHSFDRLLGTSAGAITATLIAAGYTSAEMLQALSEKEQGRSVFAGFMGTPMLFSDVELEASAIRRLLEGIDITFVPDFVQKSLRDKLIKALAANESSRHMLALIERGGWFAADRFGSWMTARLNSGRWIGGTRAFGDLTLAEFYDATSVELSVVASDTTEESILVLNHRTAPDCPVVWAVRMSMSIPLVWDEVIWRAEWGKYLGLNREGHVIVDGGLLSNFPIELFISEAPQVTKLMGPKSSNLVLGLLIDEKLPVPVSLAKGLLASISIKPSELKTIQRLQRLVNTATGAHDKMVIDEYRHLVARLPAQGYGTTEFDMDDTRRAALVGGGRAAMAEYFSHAAQDAGRKGFEKSLQSLESSPADRIAKSILRQGDQTNSPSAEP